MNKISTLSLKLARKIYNRLSGRDKMVPESIQDPDIVSAIILKALNGDDPCMISRFGSTELTCLVNYLAIRDRKINPWGYIKGSAHPWWWETNIMKQMQDWSGFFPPTQNAISAFCEMMIEEIPMVDILGSWLPDELFFDHTLQSCTKVNLELLNPYFSKVPWTNALADKRVLVVHPFSDTIQHQYQKRQLIFPNGLLPEFSLKTVKAVQSIAGERTPYKTWFDALEYMKSEIDKVDYDICLIGCGAYGFPLAAHVKKQGKKGFHLGGSLQLLFGIRGKRWEVEDYNEIYNYSKLINEHWVKPSESERPMNAMQVEGACYW